MVSIGVQVGYSVISFCIARPTKEGLAVDLQGSAKPLSVTTSCMAMAPSVVQSLSKVT